jgi:hypothetical protein
VGPFIEPEPGLRLLMIDDHKLRPELGDQVLAVEG